MVKVICKLNFMKLVFRVGLILLAVSMFCFFPNTNSQASTNYNVYYGQLHNHSSLGDDGKGTPEQAYTHARDKAKMDFFSLADHCVMLDAAEWETLKKTAGSLNQDGVFVAFWGFEWTSGQGHVAVVNTPDYCSAVDPSTDTFPKLIEWLSKREGVGFLNHPGFDFGDRSVTGPQFSHFAITPSDKIVGMELWNKGDGFKVYYYNDGFYKNDGNKGYYDEALSRGWKIGASGSADNHNADWGTNNDYRLAVLAPVKTKAAIYEAFQARRFFSTLDKNLALSFEINGTQMGSTIKAGTYDVVIKASDANNEKIVDIRLIKNGTLMQTWKPKIAKPEITQSLTTSAGDYYYIIVKQADGDEAISSPIWIQ